MLLTLRPEIVLCISCVQAVDIIQPTLCKSLRHRNKSDGWRGFGVDHIRIKWSNRWDVSVGSIIWVVIAVSIPVVPV